MRGHLAICVAVLAMQTAAGAQDVCVALPQPLADRVAEALRAAWPQALDRNVTVRVVAPTSPLEGAAGRAAILVADGPTLHQRSLVAALAELPPDADIPPSMRVTSDRRVALPWSLGYSVCGDVANVAQRERPEVSWEDLALAFGLGDRLRIAPPTCDRGPWLLAMHETLRRGGGDNAVFGVWTALDARIAAYEPDYVALAAACARDSSLTVAVPTPVAASTSFSSLARVPLAGALPIGLCVCDGVGKEGAFALLLEILQPSIEVAVRERVGFVAADIGDAEVPSDSIEKAFSHFALRIQGQGRHVERVADWLDFAALSAMALVLVVILVRQRKGVLK